MENITEPIESFWVVIPHFVLAHKKLEHIDKLMYGEISSLTRKNGICYAHNKHFESVLNVNQSTITRSIKRLEDENLISVTITHIMDGKRGTYRQIRLEGLHLNQQGGYTQMHRGATPKCIDKVEIHNRNTKESVFDKNESERIRSKSKEKTNDLLKPFQKKKVNLDTVRSKLPDKIKAILSK